METVRIQYDDKVVRWFILASIVFGIVGMLVGVLVALQLAVPSANVAPLLTFGRLRPLHTNAVIFAFVGNMMFAGVYYSLQRLTKARLASDLLSKIHFFGWQAIIVAAAVTLPLGITQGKEYAELEWPIDLAIAVVWVVFAINFFWTLANRREKHLYVALWFYIATIVTVAMLHIVNSLAIPVLSAGLKSYSIFGGVQDALVQWWYGHNAVAFFLTTPILGIMYYFLPKAADRPVFSYRLSIVHFWSLVFIYIWAGPHHLLYTALPDWAQTLGMIFSLMLWAPSWGGMLNGLLTLRGAWDKLRSDPVLKFFAAGVTFYGMATFEGPLLSIKSVSGLAHYTDWIIAHVHSGAMGWNGFMAAGLFYYLVPKLYGRELHSRSLANFHFWIGTIGILLYVGAMWTSGIQQGLMWRAENAGGGLQYARFIQTVTAIRPMYYMRLVGGSLYLVGFLIMAYNLLATMRAGSPVQAEATVPAQPEPKESRGLGLVLSPQVAIAVVGCGLILAGALSSAMAAVTLITFGFVVLFGGLLATSLSSSAAQATWHSRMEGKAVPFTVLTTVAAFVGGVAELIPSIVAAPDAIRSTTNVPYSALELEGRDVYLREGCYTCHSQMVRPFTWETARWGAVSSADDSVFDHPFQWGSRRIGPDLAHLGGRYNDVWHYQHMVDPRQITEGSNMPAYAHLANEPVDFGSTGDKLRAHRSVGVPYSDAQIASATSDARGAAHRIAEGLSNELGIETCTTGSCDLREDSRMVALIAYLQRLGAPRRGSLASVGGAP